MATAVGPFSRAISATEEEEYFQRLCMLLIGEGSKIMRLEFDKIIPPTYLPKCLEKNKTKLENLPTNVLTGKMQSILYAKAPIYYGCTNDFDMSLLMVLFRNLCNLSPPPSTGNWNEMPSADDSSLEADLVRLKCYRNELFAHTKGCSIGKPEFQNYWNEISSVIIRRGSAFGPAWKNGINNILITTLTVSETRYIEELKQWYQHDTDVKKVLTEIRDSLSMMRQQTGLSLDNFEDFDIIGEGTFAKVFKVKHKIDQHTYAIKQSHISVKKKKGIRKLFKEEVKILCDLSHQNVVKYSTSFLDVEGHFCIVMEYCAKDLAKCLKNQSDMNNLIKPNFLEIFQDIISALEYIHSRKIIHRDMKPANVFLSSLDNSLNVKIGDFGLSKYDDQSAISCIGSPRYSAPEQSSGKYDCKVDMFSAGIILFELAKLEWEDDGDGKDDEEENDDDEEEDDDEEKGSWGKVLENLRCKTTEVLEEFEPFRPAIVKDIIVSLLKKDPKARKSATEVRLKLNTGQAIPLPTYWKAMPKDLSKEETAYHVAALETTSPEYKNVHRKVMMSSQKSITRVISISRIQNPQLYRSFMARKEEMEGIGLASNERELFHGTLQESCDGINRHGFDRKFARLNGIQYGRGVYFTVDSSMACLYAEPGTSGERHLYLAKVLTGEFTKGQISYKVAPQIAGRDSTDVQGTYDSVVNDIQNPKIYVTFGDRQWYPEYLIIFE